MTSSKYRHIIWDWNGTLVNDLPLILTVINSLLQEHSLPLIDCEAYQSLHRHPMRLMYESFGFEFTDDDHLAATMESFHRQYVSGSPSCSLHSGTADILQRVIDTDRTQSILSALQQTYLNSAVEHHKIGKFFNQVHGLNDLHGHSKIEIGKNWLQKSNFKPHEVVIIGDTDHDYEVAEALGIDCILVSCGCQSRERLSKFKCPVFDSIEEAGNFLG